MHIKILDEGFYFPADSRIKLAGKFLADMPDEKDTEGNVKPKVKSLLERYRPWLTEDGRGWYKTTRPLYFKPGATFEYDGVIKDRLVQSKVEFVKPTAAQKEALVTPAEKVAVKKATAAKKKAAKKA